MAESRSHNTNESFGERERSAAIGVMVERFVTAPTQRIFRSMADVITNHRLQRNEIILFFFYLLFSFSLTAQTLNKAEYYFDIDPGAGNGTAVTITPAAALNINFPINISSLTDGFHLLAFRFRDNSGTWGHANARLLYVAPLIATAVNLTKAEYIIDTDSGPGSGITLPLTPGGSLDNNFAIDVTSLTAGFHNFGIRYRDDKTHWGHTASRILYVIPSGATPINLTKAEYIIDTDPGAGNGTPLPITPGGSLDNNFVIDVTPLTVGFHNLGIRYRDDKTHWSHTVSRILYVIA